MGEWIVGAAINVFGSIGINFGTNLLKLGHNQKEQLTILEAAETGEKTISPKPIFSFQSWRIGILFFSLGNVLNFISFGYAAQSLLAALGSIQFLSNVAFAYFVLNEKVTSRTLLATLFIVGGNLFLVAFGNHQSTVYTHEELLANYVNGIYLLYCLTLVIIVTGHHLIYRQGRMLISQHGEQGINLYWHTLLPFSYAVVSGAIGSHSVLFAKSLSILLRLTMNGDSQIDGWFTYLMLFLFVSTASFWMTRLNDGLAMFDAVLIVPMLQITWTFFSIFTGFIYFAEYKVLDKFRIAMSAIGVSSLFLGISILAPNASKGPESRLWEGSTQEVSPLIEVVDRSIPAQSERETWIRRPFIQQLFKNTGKFVKQIKTACRLSLGLDQSRIPVTSIFAMPMIASSRMTWRSSKAVDDEWLASINSLTDEGLEEPSTSVSTV